MTIPIPTEKMLLAGAMVGWRHYKDKKEAARDVWNTMHRNAPEKEDALIWRDMSSAPKDGKHCILSIKVGAFVYSIQGAFMNGKWMNVADIDSEPLAWMPNILLPDEFCPWTEAYKEKHR